MGTVAGRTATFGDVSLTASAESAGDDFVIKYDPAGNAVWAGQVAGNPDQVPTGLAIDATGNSYVLGAVTGAVAVFGVTTLFSPYQNYYLAKFRTDGSAVWALQGRDAGFLTQGLTIAVNGFGNAYVGGRIDADLFWGKLAVDNDSSPPTILRQPPPNLLVHTGGSATLSVLAAGAQPASYQWRLDGTDIVGATNNSLTVTSAIGDPASDLVIAWTEFSGESRQAFRDALALDEDTWARGRGWLEPDPGTGRYRIAAAGIKVLRRAKSDALAPIPQPQRRQAVVPVVALDGLEKIADLF